MIESIIKDKQFKVFVRCNTYNQSLYIKDALTGFVIQKTDFPFVCMIMDDCSLDGEQQILLEWMESNCDMNNAKIIEIVDAKVIIVPHNTNANCTFAFYLLTRNTWKEKHVKVSMYAPWRNHCEYEAICEGDDYWICECKLQKQIDFLDANSECSYLFTNRIIKDDRNGVDREICYRKSVYYTHDILAGFNPGIQSVVFRKIIFNDFDSYSLLSKSINADRLLPYLASRNGYIGRLESTTAVYRVTGEGVYSSIRNADLFRHAIKDISLFHELLGYPDKNAYLKAISIYVRQFIFKEKNFKSIKDSYNHLSKMYPEFSKKDFLYVLFRISCYVFKKIFNTQNIKTYPIRYDEKR